MFSGFLFWQPASWEVTAWLFRMSLMAAGAHSLHPATHSRGGAAGAGGECLPGSGHNGAWSHAAWRLPRTAPELYCIPTGSCTALALICTTAHLITG